MVKMNFLLASATNYFKGYFKNSELSTSNRWVLVESTTFSVTLQGPQHNKVDITALKELGYNAAAAAGCEREPLG